MLRPSTWLISIVAIAFAIMGVPRADALGTAAGIWRTFGGISDGCAGSVWAQAVAANGDLYVGGAFRVCGNAAASTIARWDGSQWSALGSGTDGTVYAIAVAGSDVYVAGTFTAAGGVAANGIARWDGSAWHALGSGLARSNGTPSKGAALAIVGTDLYVGGAFDSAGGQSTAGIAHWDAVGQKWSALGSGVSLSSSAASVSALAVIGSQVFVGGRFDHAGTTPAANIAAWDGANWSALGGGTSGIVNALATAGSTLYVGGTFVQADGVGVSNIAAWNGTTWSGLGSGVNFSVQTLTSAAALVYAGGGRFGPGGYAQPGLAQWDGSTWSDVGGGIGTSHVIGRIAAVAVTHGQLYVAGRFDAAGGVPARFIAGWDGSAWHALGAFRGDGIPSAVNALATYAGRLCVGAAWTVAYDVGYLACWDGAHWSAPGASPFYTPFGVLALATSGNTLYIGDYTQASTCCVHTWDGSAYGTPGGVLPFMDSDVGALFVDGSALYAGGDFDYAGSGTAAGGAIWDGNVWQPQNIGYDVTSFATFGGTVYAGGTFGSVKGWNGSTWSEVATFDGAVYALQGFGDELFAGGAFSHVGGTAANGLARWDGTTWRALSTISGNGVTYRGAPAAVHAFARQGSRLYVGGQFDNAGGTPANDVAAWDGVGFTPLGVGANNGIEPTGYVNALSASDTDICVGGQFGSAGGVLSSSIACYTPPDEIFASTFE
jgi:hypothetical protein